MLKPIFAPRTILLLAFIVTMSAAQTPSEASLASLPIEVQRQAGRFYFVASPALSGFRVALYDRTGTSRGESTALTNPPLRWPVPQLEPGVYLCVVWLRGQGGTEKRLARLEVQSATMKLQAAEHYLKDVEPPDSAVSGTPDYRAVKRRAKERGTAAIPFFRTATQVLPQESAAWLLLVQAIRTKYARFNYDPLASLLPPPPPPPPPPLRASPVRRKPNAAPSTLSNLPRAPTPEENQEMLTAGQNAVALAKSCANKVSALRWLVIIHGEMEQPEAQMATLEQIALASCATTKIKAESWYFIGVLGWHCAYNLTTRYADPKRLTAEPFHYRNLTNTDDERKFASCLQRAMAALDKALTLNPDFANAWSYRSLLYREQQKITASPAEQQKFDAAAVEASQRAIELTQKQPRQ